MVKFPCYTVFSKTRGFLISEDVNSSNLFDNVITIDDARVITDPVSDSSDYAKEPTYLINICKHLYLKKFRDVKVYEYANAYERTELKHMHDQMDDSYFFGHHDEDI